MDNEYHYYITYIIALRAGFERNDAFKIAYSSQYTDDNDKAFTVNNGQPGYLTEDFPNSLLIVPARSSSRAITVATRLSRESKNFFIPLILS